MANIFDKLNPLNWVKDIIQPVTSLIDNLHTSDAERDEAKIRLLEVTHELQSRLLDYETELVIAQSKIITAEAKGGRLAASWRPILMLSITAMLVNNYILLVYFPWAQPIDFPPELFTLLTIGVGGYIFGRSGEKMISTWKAPKES